MDAKEQFEAYVRSLEERASVVPLFSSLYRLNRDELRQWIASPNAPSPSTINTGWIRGVDGMTYRVSAYESGGKRHANIDIVDSEGIPLFRFDGAQSGQEVSNLDNPVDYEQLIEDLPDKVEQWLQHVTKSKEWE